MKHDELARELAKEAGVAKAAAQDQIEELVQRILKKLRRGRPVALPGLGKLVARPGKRQ
jgi:nucleoid DNA-binding protein